MSCLCPGPKPLRLKSYGVGKLFLSKMNEAELDSYLARSNLTPFTPYALMEKDKISKDLERIRRQGYSVDNEEMEEGLPCR